ncbi:hypothetical protein [Luteimonas kalidii]|uniref:DUF4345 domain-containing protein n=1 Tax=Luteimonas kalidii TaxID=3042025 RepID=A0ABT6JXZ3_9GAMM|nr:hypothetical protein [Luteimonas kalidii]MDH5835021.1 hypothetical protein [Luteimonas kalidii]
MPAPSRWTIAARSLAAIALAVVSIPTVNLVGGWLSEAVGLPRGGTLRLAVDLAWVFAAGTTGAFVGVAAAAVARRAHAWAFFATYLTAALYAAITMGADFPSWFTLGLLASLPLQVWLGWRLAAGFDRRRPARRGPPGDAAR